MSVYMYDCLAAPSTIADRTIAALHGGQVSTTCAVSCRVSRLPPDGPGARLPIRLARFRRATQRAGPVRGRRPPRRQPAEGAGRGRAAAGRSVRACRRRQLVEERRAFRTPLVWRPQPHHMQWHHRSDGSARWRRYAGRGRAAKLKAATGTLHWGRCYRDLMAHPVVSAHIQFPFRAAAAEPLIKGMAALSLFGKRTHSARDLASCPCGMGCNTRPCCTKVCPVIEQLCGRGFRLDHISGAL